MPAEPAVVRVAHEQKGELLVLHALLMAVLRGLPQRTLAEVLREFDLECAIVRTGLLNSTAPDSVLNAFDTHVAGINQVRGFRTEG